MAYKYTSGIPPSKLIWIVRTKSKESKKSDKKKKKSCFLSLFCCVFPSLHPSFLISFLCNHSSSTSRLITQCILCLTRITIKSSNSIRKACRITHNTERKSRFDRIETHICLYILLLLLLLRYLGTFRSILFNYS